MLNKSIKNWRQSFSNKWGTSKSDSIQSNPISTTPESSKATDQKQTWKTVNTLWSHFHDALIVGYAKPNIYRYFGRILELGEMVKQLRAQNSEKESNLTALRSNLDKMVSRNTEHS